MRRYWDVYSYRYCAVDINATPKMFGKLRKPLRPVFSSITLETYYYFYSFLEKRERKSTRNDTRHFETRSLIHMKVFTEMHSKCHIYSNIV